MPLLCLLPLVLTDKLLAFLGCCYIETICNDDFQHKTALQCWNNVATI